MNDHHESETPLACPFCGCTAHEAGSLQAAASEYDNPTCEAEMDRRTRSYWAEFDAIAALDVGTSTSAHEENQEGRKLHSRDDQTHE